MLKYHLSAALAVLIASPALACSLPAQECRLSNGQIAMLLLDQGNKVMFSQHDPNAATYSETLVVVDCTTRQAVALGDTTAEYATAAHDRYDQARQVMYDAVDAKGKPRLGALYRALKGLDQRSKRFKLRKSHCGCDLPSLPRPGYSCPEF